MHYLGQYRTGPLYLNRNASIQIMQKNDGWTFCVNKDQEQKASTFQSLLHFKSYYTVVVLLVVMSQRRGPIMLNASG